MTTNIPTQARTCEYCTESAPYRLSTLTVSKDQGEGLDLTPEQQRILTWFETWDQPTLNAMADVIRTARAERPTR